MYRRSVIAQPTPLFVGLDVHKDSIAVAHAVGQSADPPVFVGAIGTRQADIAKLVRRRHAKTSHLVFAYEAGPCGYGLHRYLTEQGHASRFCRCTTAGRSTWSALVIDPACSIRVTGRGPSERASKRQSLKNGSYFLKMFSSVLFPAFIL